LKSEGSFPGPFSAFLKQRGEKLLQGFPGMFFRGILPQKSMAFAWSGGMLNSISE